jgi:hypothetical protein
MQYSDTTPGVADVFRAGFDSYVKSKDFVPAQYYKIANAIVDCRTEQLGGMVYQCEECAQSFVLFHSCRNRHCPKCQAMARAAWVVKRTNELPQTDYFHVVFTIPPLLKRYALSHKELFYSLMFRAASSSLLELGADPKYLGGVTGIIAVLHTWTQTLCYHPHIHCIVPAGALSADGVEWIESRKRFLFPAEVLRKLYRGKLMAYFRDAVKGGEIAVATEHDKPGGGLNSLLDSLYKTKWVVYLKESFTRPDEIVKYLAAYINRIAISDKRIVKIDADTVTFRYTDRSDNNQKKLLTLSLNAFIARFFLHAVPAGFMRIRYYGFLANRNRTKNTARCRTAVTGKLEVTDCTNEDGAEIEVDFSEVVVVFPRCTHCNSTHVILTKELPQRRREFYRKIA